MLIYPMKLYNNVVKQLGLLVPTFNRSGKLEILLTNIILQIVTFKLENKIDVYISDNYSNDDTNEICLKFQSKYKFIKFKRNTSNIGSIQNIISLLHFSNCEFVWFLGDDDLISKNTLIRIIKILDSKQVSSIFINHSLKKGEYFTLKKIYLGKGGVYSGRNFLLKNFYDVFGGFMFLSANIYKKSAIMSLVGNLQKDELNFLALPIIFHFATHTKDSKIYAIKETLIIDNIKEISWKEYYFEVYFYQIPKLINTLSKFGYDKTYINILNLAIKAKNLPLVIKGSKYKGFNKVFTIFSYYKIAFFYLLIKFPRILYKKLITIYENKNTKQ
jgi:hypothetical protein